MMTALMANEIPDEWYESWSELLRFGRALLTSEYLTEHNVTADNSEAEALLQFFDSPHYWNRAYAWWVANDCPGDWKTWEHGHKTAWKVGK